MTRTDHAPDLTVALFAGVVPPDGEEPLAQAAGAALARAGYALRHGGYNGLMEAAARGAAPHGVPVTAITLADRPDWGAFNPFVTATVHAPTMAERLHAYLDDADLVVAKLTLFTATRDFRRFDRELHADLANPWLVRARQAARALGESRGWSRWIASDVNRALVIVLSGFRDGESIRYSELFPALRVRGLPVVRTAEVLDRPGLFADDRAPAVDRWLERKLDGMPTGIHRAVEAWVRTLLDGGPRSEPRSRHTAWAYLGEIRPVLLEWSSRYDHLREVTREDIIAVRDAATGKQRESRIVALRSLFRHAKKNGQIFRNPTIRIRVPRQTGGVLQALVQADIDEAIAAASTPDVRLIVALAAVHAARPKMIRTMQLEDVDLGNRRITVGGHRPPTQPLAEHGQPPPADHPEDRRRTRPGWQALDHPCHPQPHRHPGTAPR
ncbi:hypothetical protein [Streptomyces sp. FXJ7.023]|uniref:hypothetical protein n=1 Tax=Streptomyces sp. FXJ7.023 TaxID=579932 RepID=UPI00039FB776|nr:hypothetical protein [Streptomyces sp. FXJ7.023]